MSWSQMAWDTMSKVMFDMQRDGITNKAEIAKMIDKSYPFGERKRWPYKAWLQTRKQFFGQYGLPYGRKKSNNGDMFSNG